MVLFEVEDAVLLERQWPPRPSFSHFKIGLGGRVGASRELLVQPGANGAGLRVTNNGVDTLSRRHCGIGLYRADFPEHGFDQQG